MGAKAAALCSGVRLTLSPVVSRPKMSLSVFDCHMKVTTKSDCQIFTSDPITPERLDEFTPG